MKTYTTAAYKAAKKVTEEELEAQKRLDTSFIQPVPADQVGKGGSGPQAATPNAATPAPAGVNPTSSLSTQPQQPVPTGQVTPLDNQFQQLETAMRGVNIAQLKSNPTPASVTRAQQMLQQVMVFSNDLKQALNTAA